MNDFESESVEQSSLPLVRLNAGHTKPIVEAGKKLDVEKLPDPVKACIAEFTKLKDGDSSSFSSNDLITMVTFENSSTEYRKFVLTLLDGIDQEVGNVVSISSVAAASPDFVKERISSSLDGGARLMVYLERELGRVLDEDYFNRFRGLNFGIESLSHTVDNNKESVSSDVQDLLKKIQANSSEMKNTYSDLALRLSDDEEIRGIVANHQDFSARLFEKSTIIENDYQVIIGGSRERDG